MDLASWINVVLSGAMLWLTITIFKLNKTMTKIAEDDKQEKNGHDLSIVLPTALWDNSTKQASIINFCIVNHKNRMETIYRIYIKDENEKNDFWVATEKPIVIPPYDTVLVPKKIQNTQKDITNIKDYEIYAVTNDCTFRLNKNIDCYNKPLEEREYKMTNISDECHQDYIRFRNENDALRIQEQSKMDNIIITCNLGLIGIAFAFMGIIFDKNPTCYLYFILAMLFSFLSIIANYYSSWCSVKDICISNVKLDERYLNGEDIHEEISTKYTKWINRLNKWAMLFLIISIAFFFNVCLC